MGDKENGSPRTASADEMSVLKWLLEHGNPEAQTFAPQIERIRITRWCNCGCPSLALHVEDGAPRGTSPHSIVADVIGWTPDGKRVGLILFQKNGMLSVLDVHPAGLIDGDFGLPAVECLQTWEDLGRSGMPFDAKSP